MRRCFCKKTLGKGERFIELPAVIVDWGRDDLRDVWEGSYAFCSFACLSEWAAEKRVEHDGRVLVEGAL